ncbi:hypothetical protein BD289DRAFT_480623 [Coniella lustricola]|uniref:Uncharacterized protein n=1 Tax=Coniella lustricola TaxID=2025994 RepID=A0A2T3AEZ4_9PEZI|nr:hypothetical protein BD289DRAFT_480623 [Coniella lustricola]
MANTREAFYVGGEYSQAEEGQQTVQYGTWPQAKLYTQRPGASVQADPVFGHFFVSCVQMVNDMDRQ